MRLSKKTFHKMGWFTLFGFGIVGYALIHFWQKQDFLNILLLDEPVWFHIVFGAIIGALITQIISLIIDISWFENMRNYFVDLIGPIQLPLSSIVFVSFCAGVGEEIFFRGALQFWIGIWLTSIVFVALHGYVNPKNIKMTIYGLLLIVASAGFGYLADYVGLLSAIVAHILYDIIMFCKLNSYYKESTTIYPNR